MIWHVLACVAMALMVLSCVVQFTAWMGEGTAGANDDTVGKIRFLARTLLVLAILLQSAITMHVAVGTPW